MKLVTFAHGTTVSAGILSGSTIVELKSLGVPGTAHEFIGAGPAVWKHAAGQLAAWKGATIPLSSVKLLAPLPNPGKIMAIGLNYMDHCREQGVKPPERPLIFCKFTTAIVGPGDVVSWDTALTKQVDFEVELAVVIGKRARNVSQDKALDYVFGYTVMNDVSARDLQFSDGQWVRAKSLDTFAPMGPAIVSADEIADPQALKLKCVVNGQVMQDSSTKQMIFGVAHLVADLSRAFTLQPGDMITTGTPHGVGVFRNPKVFLKDGDTVACEIEGIGTLTNTTHCV